jgi:hypothetical protein
MALRNNNFGIFSATGGNSSGGGGACVSSIGIAICQGSGLCLTYTSNPITNIGTFSLSNLCPYFGQSVHVLDSGTCSTIRCQVNNSATCQYSASLGGQCNNVSSSYSVVSGGFNNDITTNPQSFIGGGANNNLCASNSVILGGTNNNIYCVSSFDYTFGSIGGGDCNIMSSGATISTTPYSFIGGGQCNTQQQVGGVTRPGVIMGGFCNSNITDHSIGGGAYNTTSGGIESTIVGGACNSIETNCVAIIGGSCNRVLGSAGYGTIGGGFKSTTSSNGLISIILGGYQNNIDGCDATIGGGCSNTTICRNVAIVGGEYNYGNGIASFIGGGLGNVICETTSGISSGSLNSIANANIYGVFSISSTLINLYNDVSSQFSVNDIVYYLDNASERVYQATITNVTYNSGSGYTELSGSFSGTSVTYLRNLTKTTSNSTCFSLIDEGYANTSSASYTSILNGVANIVNNNFSNIFNGNSNATCNGGNSCHNQIDNGKLNLILSSDSCFNTILNGCNNDINSNCFNYGVITNGLNNCVTSSIGGGFQVVGGCSNLGVGYASYIGSGICNNIYDATNNPTCNIASVIVGGVGNNTIGGTWSEGNFGFTSNPTITSGGKYSFIGGGFQNVSKFCSNVVGGQCNCVYNDFSFIGGGANNYINASGEVSLTYSTILGGFTNVITNISNYSFIGGGSVNTLQGEKSTIYGGQLNTINYQPNALNFIGGGCNNTLGNFCNVILGGCTNTISSYLSTIGGGKNQNITSSFSNSLGGTNTTSSAYTSIIGANNTIPISNNCSIILGNNTTSNTSCTTFVNSLSIINVPNCCQSGLPLGRSANGQIITLSPNTFQSVGLCVPQGLCVYSTNPLTSGGNLCVCGGGLSSQYITGLGTLANFPNETGGGGQVYYFNGGTNQGSFGGNTYYQMSGNASTSTQATFPLTGNGTIARFITDANQPNLLYVPSGKWNVFAYFNATNKSTNVAANLYVYNGSTFTQIGVGTIEVITNGTTIDLYTLGISVSSGTNIASTDRLAIEFVASSNGAQTVTLYTQDNTISSVLTTLPSGLGSLNGLINSSQTFATCTNGTNFAITSANGVHCWSLPTASSTNRGALSSSDWTCFNTCGIGCCLPAYSFQANCCASFGAYSNLCYYESPECTNSCTISWTPPGGSSGCVPSGLISNTYRWTRYGNFVSLQFQVLYSILGQCVNAVCIPTPSVLPIAAPITNMTTNNTAMFFGAGGFICAFNSIACTPLGGAYMGRVYIKCFTDAPSNNRQLQVQQSGFNCNVAGFWGTINYITT